jgi:large subunit ribosomal protein L22
MVDGGRVIRRMRPAPQGRGYRIRKRSNHVTLIVDSKPVKNAKAEKVTTKKEQPVEAVAAPEVKEVKKTRTKRTTTKKTTE